MFGEFDTLVREVMAKKHSWFKGVEPPVGEDAAAKVEAKLGCILPSQFKHFAITFGGGYFGGINLSTLDETSDWYVLARPPIQVNGNNMLVVSDDEAGGYYGFVFGNGEFESEITYVSLDDGNHLERTAPSFFEFIKNFAINI